MHDAFVRLLTNASRTGMADPAHPWPAGQVASYLRQTVANLCLDRYRASQRRPQQIHLDALPEDVLPAVRVPDRVVQQETAAEVRGALRRLPPPQQQALVLWEVEQVDTSTIATTLNMDVKNVKHLLGRARKGLKSRLEAVGFVHATDAAA